jgi:peptide/nickel transport system permease protein
VTRPRGVLVGAALLAAVAVVALAAPALAPHEVAQQFDDYGYAPPMRPHVLDADGHLRAPFVYPLRLDDRLARRFVELRDRPQPLRWLAGGKLLSIDERDGPWLPLGGDVLGRDIFSRLVIGTRLSMALAVIATCGALLLGALAGALAGFTGGLVDDLLMRLADFILILPAIYVVMALRGLMPLVLSNAQVFWTIAAVLSAAGWPYAARGVRAVVAGERHKEYAEAARAIGAGRPRILLRHLLPAARGFLAVQATLLLPAFIVAEATLSFVGLGFAEPTPSLGVMLQDAASGPVLAEAPWLLAPAAAIVLCTVAVHLVIGRRNSGEGQPRSFM